MVIRVLESSTSYEAAGKDLAHVYNQAVCRFVDPGIYSVLANAVQQKQAAFQLFQNVPTLKGTAEKGSKGIVEKSDDETEKSFVSKQVCMLKDSVSIITCSTY